MQDGEQPGAQREAGGSSCHRALDHHARNRTRQHTRHGRLALIRLLLLLLLRWDAIVGTISWNLLLTAICCCCFRGGRGLATLALHASAATTISFNLFRRLCGMNTAQQQQFIDSRVNART